MKALIIGGNRFVGRHLTELLLQQDANVTLLNRGRHGNPFGTRLEHLVCDRQDEAQLEATVQGRKWDVIFDQVCFDAKDARAACRIFGGKTPLYVFTSSNSVYTPGRNLTEDLFNPRIYQFKKDIDSSDDYAEAKRQCESVFSQQNKFRVVIPRLPFICGQHDHTGRLLFHIMGVKKGERIYVPNPEAQIAFINAEEAARIFLFLSTQKDLQGPINCSSIDTASLNDIIQWVEIAVGKKAKLTSIEITGEPSPYGVKTDWNTDLSRLVQLGFKPSSIKDWMPQLIRDLSDKYDRTNQQKTV